MEAPAERLGFCGGGVTPARQRRAEGGRAGEWSRLGGLPVYPLGVPSGHWQGLGLRENLRGWYREQVEVIKHRDSR